MWIVLSLLISGLLLVVGLALVVALVRLVVELVARLLLALALAVTAGLVAGVVGAASGEFDAFEGGVLVAALSLVPALVLAFRVRRELPRARPGAPQAAALAAIQGKATGRDQEEAGIVLPITEPPADAALGAAWAEAEEFLPRHVARLHRARESCARLLQLQALDCGVNHARLELAVLIRNHVPPLVRETRAACEGAAPLERAELENQMCSRLEELGRRAEELVDEERRGWREKVAVRHAHLRRRLGASSAS